MEELCAFFIFASFARETKWAQNAGASYIGSLNYQVFNMMVKMNNRAVYILMIKDGSNNLNTCVGDYADI